MELRCVSCYDAINIDKFSRKIDKNNHILFCKNCIRSTGLCSKSKCKETFLLDDTDLRGLKYLYIDNINNKNKYYLHSDIERIVLKKYGNFGKLQQLKTIKKSEKKEKEKERVKKIRKRRNKLNKVLKMNKLEYVDFGDCYSYVHYGHPSIEKVVKNELERLTMQSKRKVELSKKLQRLGIPLDESLKSCYNYIYQVGYKNLNETARAIEMEYFFKYKTDFEELIKKYPEQQAKDVALKRYIERSSEASKVPDSVSSTVSNRIVLKFD